ncbi:TPA: type III-B CRISPR-associated protein Cas10/Cmr2 [Neisseria polysaccharea]
MEWDDYSIVEQQSGSQINFGENKMTQYVLILSVEPVQGFIASERRSRDLWSGSWLLSETAKAAKCLFEAGARMVFPFVGKLASLNSCDTMENNFSVGNKI